MASRPSPLQPDDPAAEVAALFTRSEGGFRFARWNRPLAPVIFGTDEHGERLFRTALTRVAGLGELQLANEDPDLGVNFLVFFVERWPDLAAVPHLDRLIPDLPKLIDMLGATGANQYRIFGFDDDGAIRICTTLLRYDDDLQRVSAGTLALGQSLLGMLLWSDTAFLGESPVALVEGGGAAIKPWHARLVRAAYDPGLPVAADDPAFALRLEARMRVLEGQGL